jgi:glycosyltransferase involved in cell wall biosynthesis
MNAYGSPFAPHAPSHHPPRASLTVLAWPAFDNTTGNPYNRLLYEAVERQGVRVEEFTLRNALAGGHDLWHVHWPDDFLSRPSTLEATAYVVAELLLMTLARARGTRLVWTVHDLGPHESHHPWLERVFWRFFLPQVDGFVTLSTHARDAARRRFPRLRHVPNAVVPHGHYRPAYPNPVPHPEARSALHLAPDAPVVAFIGRIRPYKNVERLIAAFRGWSEADARLLIVGNPSSDALQRSIEQAASGDRRIRLDLRFVPDDDLALVLGACDLVALPYEHILHSGSALLALSFDRPVLLPEQGAMAELRQHVGANWVRTYNGALTSDTLAAAVGWAQHTARPKRAPLDDLSWDAIARHTLALYRRVLRAP